MYSLMMCCGAPFSSCFLSLLFALMMSVSLWVRSSSDLHHHPCRPYLKQACTSSIMDESGDVASSLVVKVSESLCEVGCVNES